MWEYDGKGADLVWVSWWLSLFLAGAVDYYGLLYERISAGGWGIIRWEQVISVLAESGSKSS